MSKIQPIYLQCEDLHCKADLKLHRKKKKKTENPGISKNDNAKTEGTEN